jgi:hypothetical protein
MSPFLLAPLFGLQIEFRLEIGHFLAFAVQMRLQACNSSLKLLACKKSKSQRGRGLVCMLECRHAEFTRHHRK